MTSSGETGLNTRTHTVPKWDRTRCPEEKSILCWHAVPIANVLWKTQNGNKGPTWPHIVHLNIMCHHIFTDLTDYTKFLEDIEFLLPVFIKFRSAVSDEKPIMSQPIRSLGGHLCFLIGPKTLTW